MKLGPLLAAAGLDAIALSQAEAATDITSITADSRRAGPGVIFAALPGSVTDGRQFIAAIATGGGIGTATTAVTGDELVVFALPK